MLLSVVVVVVVVVLVLVAKMYVLFMNVFQK